MPPCCFIGSVGLQPHITNTYFHRNSHSFSFLPQPLSDKTQFHSSVINAFLSQDSIPSSCSTFHKGRHRRPPRFAGSPEKTARIEISNFQNRFVFRACSCTRPCRRPSAPIAPVWALALRSHSALLVSCPSVPFVPFVPLACPCPRSRLFILHSFPFVFGGSSLPHFSRLAEGRKVQNGMGKKKKIEEGEGVASNGRPTSI